MIHIWRPWKLSSFQDPPPPKFFHPLDIGRPISNGSPPLQMITNQFKENIIQRWLLYVIRSFIQVRFRFQYQFINLVWLSFDFFSFSWSLIICFLVALYSWVCSCPKISRNVFYLLLLIFLVLILQWTCFTCTIWKLETRCSSVRRVTWLCVIFWCHYEMTEDSHVHSTATSVHSNKW